MSRKTELPLSVPMYSTYHSQGIGGAVIYNNPTIRNWYLSIVMRLQCSRRFLTGYGSPELDIERSTYQEIPWLIVERYPMRYQADQVLRIVNEMVEDGFYVAYTCIDDYYIKGKSWYNKRHFYHDGLIFGNDRDNHTFKLFAYDENWVYRPFDISQEDFDKGKRSCTDQGIFGSLFTIKPHEGECMFHVEDAIGGMREYVNSKKEDYAGKTDGTIYGFAVQDYLLTYLDMVMDGQIRYEYTDRRIFRLLWEHKKVMLERIKKTEDALGLAHTIGNEYEIVEKTANDIRMIYAAYFINKRKELLNTIKKKLSFMMNEEERLLTELVSNHNL